MSPAELPESARLALAGLHRLASPEGFVAVSRRSDLVRASGVKRGSWDRAVKALEVARLVVIVRASSAEGRPSSYRLLPAGRDLARASQVEPGRAGSEPGGSSTSLCLSPERTSREEEQQQPTEPSRLARAGLRGESAHGIAEAIYGGLSLIADALRPSAPHVLPGGRPTCACGPRKLVTRARDGAQFWGCPGWTSAGGGCGAPTVSASEAEAPPARSERSAREAAERRAARARDGIAGPVDMNGDLAELKARLAARRQAEDEARAAARKEEAS